MVYEVSYYEVTKTSFNLLKHSYWKRDELYKGPTRVIQKHKNRTIEKFIDLISEN